MDDPLLLGIAISDTVTIAVADLDGIVIVQTAYPNDLAAGTEFFFNHLVEEAQVLLDPLPGQLRHIGMASQSAERQTDLGWLSARLSTVWGVPVSVSHQTNDGSESHLDRAITLARAGLA
ncbi:MAG: hypothetical protein KIT87_00665 [Anaerolineae bacterium]|nr:hypothetical protein [Anaerolineae bacterium]